MDTNDFLKLVAAKMHVMEVDDIVRTYREKTRTCLPLPRLRELVYRPSTESVKEARHLSICANCKRMIDAFKADAYHPPMSFFSEPDRLNGDDARNVAYHLERDRCERCLALVSSEKFTTLKNPLQIIRAIFKLESPRGPVVQFASSASPKQARSRKLARIGELDRLSLLPFIVVEVKKEKERRVVHFAAAKASEKGRPGQPASQKKGTIEVRLYRSTKDTWYTARLGSTETKFRYEARIVLTDYEEGEESGWIGEAHIRIGTNWNISDLR